MAAIVPFLNGETVFDPEAIHAMSMVLDDLCKALALPETATDAREVIAVRVIELARRGERSPTRLRDRVLQEANGGNAL